MKLNADFSARVAVHTAAQDWTPSPMPGVERKMLDRVGDEVARATSIVRFAAGSAFSAHTHGGGEEYLVLDGVFQDEKGDFPAGTYVRNPPTSRHTPASAPGCTIFVKLWQFAPEDRTEVVVDTQELTLAELAERPGVRGVVIYEDVHESVRIEEWAPETTVDLMPVDGLEILCLVGGFTESGEQFGPGGWLRLPIGAPLSAEAGCEGCRLWLKEGHLRFADMNAPKV